MLIKSLEIYGLRNLRSIRLSNCRRINILSGPNGSGKTSILEAIYFLGLGRSFRTSRHNRIINHEMDACAVFGELGGDADSHEYHGSLGVRRTKFGDYDFRVDRQPVSSAAELARALPIQLINADTLGLIEGSSKARRQFIDWGAFHVKPGFLECWRDAQRCLRQRNYLLKRQKAGQHARIYTSELAAWDRELARLSASVDNFRSQYVANIRPFFEDTLNSLTTLSGLSLHYQRGWKESIGLEAALEENFELDVRAGSTIAGPHRANIDIRVEGLPAADVLSRGQLKLVVASLKLAQGVLLARQQGRQCIYLIDDLAAELDGEHREALCQLLDEIGSQVFITSVEVDVIERYWKDKRAISQFHVKQGMVNNEQAAIVELG